MKKLEQFELKFTNLAILIGESKDKYGVDDKLKQDEEALQ